MRVTRKQVLAHLPAYISDAWLYTFMAPMASGSIWDGSMGLKNSYDIELLDTAIQVYTDALKKSQSNNAAKRYESGMKRIEAVKTAIYIATNKGKQDADKRISS